jgi:hypothetical protein
LLLRRPIPSAQALAIEEHGLARLARIGELVGPFGEQFLPAVGSGVHGPAEEVGGIGVAVLARHVARRADERIREGLAGFGILRVRAQKRRPGLDGEVPLAAPQQREGERPVGALTFLGREVRAAQDLAIDGHRLGGLAGKGELVGIFAADLAALGGVEGDGTSEGCRRPLVVAAPCSGPRLGDGGIGRRRGAGGCLGCGSWLLGGCWGPLRLALGGSTCRSRGGGPWAFRLAWSLRLTPQARASLLEGLAHVLIVGRPLGLRFESRHGFRELPAPQERKGKPPASPVLVLRRTSALAQRLLVERHGLPGLPRIGELVGIFAQEFGRAASGRFRWRGGRGSRPPRCGCAPRPGGRSPRPHR